MVTALRTRVDLQRAPAAITSVSGDTLKTANITSIEAVTTIVPGVQFNHEANATQVYIRGIGSNLDYYQIPEAVAMNIDGVYVPRYVTAGSFLDVQDVQVLPGPQGVLYGHSAGGGAILLTTKAPTDRLESIGDFELGNYSLVHVTAVQNVPLTDDLAARAGVEVLKHGGYQSFGNYAQDSLSAKLALRYHLTDSFTATVRASYYKETGKPQVASYLPLADHPYRLGPTDPVTGESTTTGYTDYKYWTLIGDLTYDFGPATLEYIAGRIDQRENSLRNTVGQDNPTIGHYVQYSQSLKLFSAPGTRLQWIAGVDWLKSDARQTGFFGKYKYGQIFDAIDGRSYSAYAQLTYSLTPSVRLVGGGRYSTDKLRAAGNDSFCIGAPGPVGPCFLVPENFKQTWHNGDFKAGVEADLTPGLFGYANVQSGYVPGTFNNYTDAVPQSAKEVKPQTLMAYTAGFKSRLADRKITLNLEGFYYRYKDLIIQSFTTSTGTLGLYNAPRTTIYGLQATAGLRLSDNDNLSANLAYTHGRYGHFVALPGVTPDLKGLQTQFTPDWTGNISYEHRFPLTSGGTISVRVNTYLTSHYWLTFAHVPDTDQDGFSKSDLSLTYTSPSDHWEISAWVRNIENNATAAASSATGYPAPYAGATELAPPRTFGARLSIKM